MLSRGIHAEDAGAFFGLLLKSCHDRKTDLLVLRQYILYHFKAVIERAAQGKHHIMRMGAAILCRLSLCAEERFHFSPQILADGAGTRLTGGQKTDVPLIVPCVRQVAYSIKGIQLFRLQQQNAFDLIVAVRHDQLCCKAAHKRQHIRPVTHNAAYAVLQNREHDRCLGDHVFLFCQRIHLGFQRILFHLKAFFGIFQFCLHRDRSGADAKRQKIIVGVAALP